MSDTQLTTTLPESLLIIDDDEMYVHVLARAFGKLGYEVFVATDQDSATQINRQQQPEKVVLDLKLGNDSGLALLPKLKADNPESQIVLLTGYSSIATAVEAMKLGATHYLCKPANTADILAAFAHQQGNVDVAIADNPPSVDRIEWEHIQKVLQEHDGNISATARALGMHRRTLQRKLIKRPVKH